MKKAPQTVQVGKCVNQLMMTKKRNAPRQIIRRSAELLVTCIERRNFVENPVNAENEANWLKNNKVL